MFWKSKFNIMPDTKVLFNLSADLQTPELFPWTPYMQFILSISKKFLRKFSQCIRLTLWNRRKKANNRNKEKRQLKSIAKIHPKIVFHLGFERILFCINKGFLQSDSSSWYEWLSESHNQKEVLYMRYMQGCPFLESKMYPSFWRRVKGSHTSTSNLWPCVASA